MRYNITRYNPDVVLEMKARDITDKCVWCKDDFRHLIINHADCNKENNDNNNLMVLCGFCHVKFHRYFPNFNHLHDNEIKWIRAQCDKILKEKNSRVIYTIPQSYRIRAEIYEIYCNLLQAHDIMGAEKISTLVGDL